MESIKKAAVWCAVALLVLVALFVASTAVADIVRGIFER